MGINEWRDRARDKEAWRRILMEAKAQKMKKKMYSCSQNQFCHHF
jgi:hypothetical protein